MAETAQSVSTQKDATTATQAAAKGVGEDAAPVLDPAARLEKANAMTRRNALWALGVGVMPFPIVDALALMAVHVKMLREFSNLYGVKFPEGIAKKLIASLFSSVGIVGIGTLIGGSLAKLVPAVGTTLGVLSVPVIAGAVTHAIGRVFTMHLEAGGTLLDFDPVAMRSYFKQEFEKAKEVVSQLHRDQPAKAGNKPA